jgi:hypothetical protein
MALAARAVAVQDRAKWPLRDRLLCAIVWDLPADAERAAREVVARRYPFGRFSPEDVESLRLWANTEAARSALARWCEAAEGDEAITALSLTAQYLGVSDLVAETVRAAFNRGFADGGQMPLDGVDSLTGRVVPWSVGAYTLLSNRQRF